MRTGCLYVIFFQLGSLLAATALRVLLRLIGGCAPGVEGGALGVALLRSSLPPSFSKSKESFDLQLLKRF